jgi:2-amino-4-hydroxy-6-hydroxymethyldihydropteridine diphosphokinase
VGVEGLRSALARARSLGEHLLGCVRHRGTGRGSGAHKSKGNEDPYAQAVAKIAAMRAYVGLGANLGERDETIERALELLDRAGGVRVIEVSTLRETDPVGFLDQPRFLNGAAAVETELEPRQLLDVLLSIERELGRTREGPKFGPRTIDLDLLVYGDRELAEPGLTVPHPRLAERAFALEPLRELDPQLEIPGRGRVSDLLRGLQSA